MYNYNMTPRIYTERKDVQRVDALLRAGARPDHAWPKRGDLPSDIVRCKNLQTVTLLLRYGVGIGVKLKKLLPTNIVAGNAIVIGMHDHLGNRITRSTPGFTEAITNTEELTTAFKDNLIDRHQLVAAYLMLKRKAKTTNDTEIQKAYDFLKPHYQNKDPVLQKHSTTPNFIQPPSWSDKITLRLASLVFAALLGGTYGEFRLIKMLQKAASIAPHKEALMQPALLDAKQKAIGLHKDFIALFDVDSPLPIKHGYC